MIVSKADHRDAILCNLKNGSYPNAVYIGRPGIWGNPYTYADGDPIDMYYEYLNNNESLLSQLGDLENKQLACWCYPSRCHGDAIIRTLIERGYSVLKKESDINMDLL